VHIYIGFETLKVKCTQYEICSQAAFKNPRAMFFSFSGGAGNYFRAGFKKSQAGTEISWEAALPGSDIPKSSCLDFSVLLCICLVFRSNCRACLSHLISEVQESMALLARVCRYERPALSCLSGVLLILCTVLGCHALPPAPAPAPAPAPTTPGAPATISTDPSDGRIHTRLHPVAFKFYSSAS
jgi:hypothetical protein